MFKWVRTKHPLGQRTKVVHSLPPDVFLCQEPRKLLGRHRGLLNEIRRTVGIPDTHYRALYHPLFHQFAAWSQEFPASEAHHHCAPGGALQHGIEVALHAVKRRRKLLLPGGATAEQLAARQDVWTYAVVSAALLHDFGKPVADIQILMLDTDGKDMGAWQPWRGNLIEQGCHAYRLSYRRQRNYRLHERLPAFFISRVMPQIGLEWLSEEREAFSLWSAMMVGDWENAGIIGEIVSHADAQSVAAILAGDQQQTPGARQRPLHERLLTGLRYLLDQEELPLNTRGAAGWIHGDSVWLVSKRTLDALREHLEREGHAGIPQRNDRLMDALQQSGSLIPCNDKAIWRAQVFAESWPQANTLTVLRFPIGKIWSDPTTAPVPFQGTVTPEGETDVATAAISEDSQPGPAIPDGRIDQQKTASRQLVEESPDDIDIFSEPTSPAPKPAPASTESTEEELPPLAESGQRFLAWLRQNLKSGLLETNTASGRIHRVPEGLLLISPGIFKDYRDPHPDATWQHVQRRFARLKLHEKMNDGTNIHVYQVVGEKSRKRGMVKGFLIPEASLQDVFPDLSLPPPNSYLQRKRSNNNEGKHIRE
jgi:integrating conjugative element relaxase (TIGR03760 family)